MPSKQTEYIILGRHVASGASPDLSRSWIAVATGVTARSSDGAIRAYLADKDISEGEYVAVPTRSWVPRQVKVESVPKVVLS